MYSLFSKVLDQTSPRVNFSIILASNEATMLSHYQSEINDPTHVPQQKQNLSMWLGLFIIALFMTACGMLLDDPALYPDMEVAGEESDEVNSNLETEE